MTIQVGGSARNAWILQHQRYALARASPDNRAIADYAFLDPRKTTAPTLIRSASTAMPLEPSNSGTVGQYPPADACSTIRKLSNSAVAPTFNFAPKAYSYKNALFDPEPGPILSKRPLGFLG